MKHSKERISQNVGSLQLKNRNAWEQKVACPRRFTSVRKSQEIIVHSPTKQIRHAISNSYLLSVLWLESCKWQNKQKSFCTVSGSNKRRSELCFMIFCFFWLTAFDKNVVVEMLCCDLYSNFSCAIPRLVLCDVILKSCGWIVEWRQCWLMLFL